MSKGRLEAFSDGVLAIIITIMVLELKVPDGADLSALQPLIPVFASYTLSFVFIGIYWNNHHHLFQAVHKINGNVLWANMHLLFWISLIPFTTSWMGENEFLAWPVAFYGISLWMSGLAYFILVRTLLAIHPEDSPLAIAIGGDTKGYVSLALYTAAIPLSFVSARFASLLYVAVAIIWFIPDRRIEKTLAK
ncbi:TMEM175 family protein [Candidatus Villigracilis saccharophilus]|uniref:TMEM175 family protein n=1 Tax=Candidatus Villigracilis saccharophilus TaxID=3140684 RepID=UPI0031352429|nr:DUF1211 domain-containing protein [Anaerolineales bacterium]